MTSTLYYTLKAEHHQQEWLSTQLVPGQSTIFVSLLFFTHTLFSLKPALSQKTLSVINSFGFKTMTEVQAQAIPLFLSSKDVIVEVVCQNFVFVIVLGLHR